MKRRVLAEPADAVIHRAFNMEFREAVLRDLSLQQLLQAKASGELHFGAQAARDECPDGDKGGENRTPKPS